MGLKHVLLYFLIFNKYGGGSQCQNLVWQPSWFQFCAHMLHIPQSWGQVVLRRIGEISGPPSGYFLPQQVKWLHHKLEMCYFAAQILLFFILNEFYEELVPWWVWRLFSEVVLWMESLNKRITMKFLAAAMNKQVSDVSVALSSPAESSSHPELHLDWNLQRKQKLTWSAPTGTTQLGNFSGG